MAKKLRVVQVTVVLAKGNHQFTVLGDSDGDKDPCQDTNLELDEDGKIAEAKRLFDIFDAIKAAFPNGSTDGVDL